MPLVCAAAGTVAISVFVSNLGNKIQLEAAERKRADEAEAAERKRVDDVVAAKTEGESSAQAQKLASIQAALRQISNDMADMKRNLQV